MTYTNIEVYSLHFDDLVIHSEHIKEKEIGKLPIMNRSTWISSSIHSKLIRRLLCHGWMQSSLRVKKRSQIFNKHLVFCYPGKNLHSSTFHSNCQRKSTPTSWWGRGHMICCRLPTNKITFNAVITISRPSIIYDVERVMAGLLR